MPKNTASADLLHVVAHHFPRKNDTKRHGLSCFLFRTQDKLLAFLLCRSHFQTTRHPLSELNSQFFWGGQGVQRNATPGHDSRKMVQHILNIMVYQTKHFNQKDFLFLFRGHLRCMEPAARTPKLQCSGS